MRSTAPVASLSKGAGRVFTYPLSLMGAGPSLGQSAGENPNLCRLLVAESSGFEPLVLHDTNARAHAKAPVPRQPKLGRPRSRRFMNTIPTSCFCSTHKKTP